MPLGHRLMEELRHYAIATVYLYVCFAALLLYKASVLHGYGIQYTPYGLALLKALILGKFLMLGEMTKIGERHQIRPINRVLLKSVSFLALLVLLSVVEEAVKGIIQGETLATSVADFAGGTWMQIAATCLLLWLILLPYLLVQQLSEIIGPARLRQIFLS